MVGGFAGGVGAFVVGPRKGRFEVMPNGMLGKPLDMPGHSMVICALGVIILWFGWYGFNAGSTLCAMGCMDLASKVAVTTTIAAAVACLTAAFLSKVLSGKFDLATGLNGVIAGLVSITAPCPVVDPWAAAVIGFVGAFVYIGSDKLMLKFHIDDPLQACPLHGFCGIWGCLAVGIFGTDAKLQAAGYPNVNDAFASGEQFAVQVVGVIAILAWTLGTSLITFYGIHYTIGMRVTAQEEEEGLDASEHGAQSYTMAKLAGVTVELGKPGAVVASA